MRAFATFAPMWGGGGAMEVGCRRKLVTFAPMWGGGADFPTELCTALKRSHSESFSLCDVSRCADRRLALQLPHKRSQRELSFVFDVSRCAKWELEVFASSSQAQPQRELFLCDASRCRMRARSICDLCTARTCRGSQQERYFVACYMSKAL